MAQRGAVAVICGIFVCLSVLYTANTTYAAVADISDCESWFEDNDYNTAQIQCNGLSGCLRFFYAKNSIYCCLSYSAGKMSGDEEISVEINISNINRSYTVCFSKTEDGDYPCNVTKHFTQLTNLGQDIYFMLEFTDKEDKNTNNCAEINLKINSKAYYIAEIDLPVYEENSEQEDAQYSGYIESEKEKEIEETTTKFVYSGDADKEDTSTQSTTKFSFESGGYSYDESAQENGYDTASPEVQGAADGELTDVPTQKETSFSTPAKAMFGLSGAFALSGTAVLIRGAVKSRAAQKAELDKQQKNDSCE